MKVIVFDVDGVLINSKDEFGNRLWQKNIKKDLGLSPDQVCQIYSCDWSLVTKGLIDARQYFEMAFTKFNIELSASLFFEYWLKHDLSINTEILSEIKKIKGFKLYIGTNQDSCRTKILQKIFGSYFDGIFSSYKIGAIKPESEFFRYIESKLNIKSKDIVFIDDSKSNIEVAAELGWTCHHYQNIEAFKKFIQKNSY